MFENAPSILYKYRFFDQKEKHLQLITHSELWFSCANKFNDPFDISFTFNFDGLNTELAERWAKKLVKRDEPNLTPAQCEKKALTRLSEIRGDSNYSDHMKKEFIEINYDTFGICSLCERNDNLLIWAHYSQNHTGFCVGLSVKHLDTLSRGFVKEKSLLDLHKVRYSRTLPNPNFFESMLSDDDNCILDFITTKFTDWSYEQEYRLVFWDYVNKALNVDYSAICEVILGCRITEENKNKLIELCQNHVPHAKIYQAEKHDKRFALSIKPIS